MDDVEERLSAVRRLHGPWTAHNIRLPGEHYTLGPTFPSLDSNRGDYFIEVSTCCLGKSPSELSVLDLGCLEGAIAIQFARAGARVDGVDIRPASIAKASVVRDILDLKDLRFFVGDALNLYGIRSLQRSYDVIVCAGLLYHLDAADQLPFLRMLQDRCRAMTIIDTHFAVDAPDEYRNQDGHIFRGRYIRELNPNASTDASAAMWAALNNERSFWLSERSLLNALSLAGFGLVARVGQPSLLWPWKDRDTWIGLTRVNSGQLFQTRLLDEPDLRPSVHPTIVAGYNCAIAPKSDV